MKLRDSSSYGAQLTNKAPKNDQCIVARQIKTKKMKLSVILLLSPALGSIIYDRLRIKHNGEIGVDVYRFGIPQ